MGRDVLSVRQIMVIGITALLAPLTDLLPGLTARTAGSGGGLAVLGALPLLIAALWTAKKTGLNGRGRLINALYLLWIPLLLAAFLYLSQVRLSAIYGGKTGAAFVVGLLLLAVWMAVGKVSAFARAAEIFYLLLAVVLAGFLLLAAFKIEWPNLALSEEELAAVPVSSVTVAGIILNVYPITALKNKAVLRAGDGREAVGWAAAFGVVISLLMTELIGCLGPSLAAGVSSPFVIMVQGLGVKGAFQRTEALVAALWGVSDLTMAGMLLHAWRELAEEIFPGRWCRWGVVPVAGIALAAGWILLVDEESVQYIYGTVLPAGGLILGLGVPVVRRLAAGLLKKDY